MLCWHKNRGKSGEAGNIFIDVVSTVEAAAKLLDVSTGVGFNLFILASELLISAV